ncbi:MPN domain-containing protein-like [Tubulanus polymorphus]|uniref:MPN domain-containing protein-like n=1 Tax=Tubulanus polymorphus TaxID=672921 RepID=UPI003DA33808
MLMDNVTDDDEEISDAELLASAASSRSTTPAKASPAPRHTITGRGVTIAMLMSDGIIEAGEGVLTIEYLRKKFFGDLLIDGRIKDLETGDIFTSPSSWAIYCKKVVNPAKKSGCGWASVKYKGKKLDVYKTIWFRKQRGFRTPTPPRTVGKSPRHDSYRSDTGDDDFSRLEFDERDRKDAGILDLSMTGPNSLPEEDNSRTVIKHSNLGKSLASKDPHTLVECAKFEDLGRIQPFTITATTNCLLIMDFHSHLTTSEVVGYLGGKWDPNTHHMTVYQAFPCRSRLGDKDNAALVEEEIQQSMDRRGLSLVGWYHSHPTCKSYPTVKDVQAQLDYQMCLKGAGNVYQPCIGIIVSPFHCLRYGRESSIRAYWVMPPTEHTYTDQCIPVDMAYDVSQDCYLSPDVIHEMKWLSDFYRGAADQINMSDMWQKKMTYLEKLKSSLNRKLPKDQANSFMDSLHLLVSLGSHMG